MSMVLLEADSYDLNLFTESDKELNKFSDVRDAHIGGSGIAVCFFIQIQQFVVWR